MVLDGTDSLDVDDDELSFFWRQLDGPSGILSDADSKKIKKLLGK